MVRSSSSSSGSCAMTTELERCSSSTLHPQQHLFSETLAHRIALSSTPARPPQFQVTETAMPTPSTASLPSSSSSSSAEVAALSACISPPPPPSARLRHSQPLPTFNYRDAFLGCLCITSAATACYCIYRYRVRATAQPCLSSSSQAAAAHHLTTAASLASTCVQDHPRIRPMLRPLFRALHLSTQSSPDAAAAPSLPASSSSSSPPDAPSSSSLPAPSSPASGAVSSSLVTVDEEQLVRLFLFSLHTLQSSGCISGDLEQALHSHLDSAAPPAPSASLQQPEHQQLYFVASQWLLLYTTLECTQAASQSEYRAVQQRARQRWMPLVWSMLCAIPAVAPLSSSAFPSASAVNLLKLDVAQRMNEYAQLSRVYRTVLRSSLSRADGRLLLEEAVVLFTAAPHLGRWDDMLQLGEMIESENGEGWLRVFHDSAKHRQDMPDYSTLFVLAAQQRKANAGKRRRSSRHTETDWRRQRKEQPEEEEKQPEGQLMLSEDEEAVAASAASALALPRPLSPSSPIPSSRLSYREWRLTSCESRYRSVECSHPELQQQAERIYSTSAAATTASASSPPAYTSSPPTASVLEQSGCVLRLVSSPLAPALCVVGLRDAADSQLRLSGWAEKDEGEGGLVTWREEYSMREEQKDDTALHWEGTRVVRRVRRKYAGEPGEDEQQVSVIWRWDVRMLLHLAEA